MPSPLVESVHAKIDEQVEKTICLLDVLPPGTREWVPPIPGAFCVGGLAGHLLECCAGVCAALYAAAPAQLAHFTELKLSPADHDCPPEQAGGRLAVFRDSISEGFRAISDADLERPIPTVFVPGGERLLTLLLGNLEHLVNHKHQLFTYLQIMGVTVTSTDLYRFRG